MMPLVDINEINIFNDDVDDADIIKNIINTENSEDAFYIADIGGVIKRHREWISKMPKVTPHYGMFITFIVFSYYFISFEIHVNENRRPSFLLNFSD